MSRKTNDMYPMEDIKKLIEDYLRKNPDKIKIDRSQHMLSADEVAQMIADKINGVPDKVDRSKHSEQVEKIAQEIATLLKNKKVDRSKHMNPNEVVKRLVKHYNIDENAAMIAARQHDAGMPSHNHIEPK